MDGTPKAIKETYRTGVRAEQILYVYTLMNAQCHEGPTI